MVRCTCTQPRYWHDQPSFRLQGFQVGAVDYITKPFQEGELLARIRTQLSLRQLTCTLQRQNLRLEEQIRERAAVEVAREEVVPAVYLRPLAIMLERFARGERRLAV